MFPDWQRVRSETVAEAISHILKIFDIERQWHGYTDRHDQVRTAILGGFATMGRTPSLTQLVKTTGLAPNTIESVLRELKSRDLVVLDAAGTRVLAAYPFAEHDTGHRVRLKTGWVNALCAVDALGIGGMMGQNTVIQSACRQCRAPIRIETSNQGADLTSYNPPSAVVWMGDWYANGCGATSLCTTITFFCSDSDLGRWQASAHHGTDGRRLSVEEAHEVGLAIFGPMLKPGMDHSHAGVNGGLLSL
jgi:DNA-binding transcriptional regulator YhcF (GntR family)